MLQAAGAYPPSAVLVVDDEETVRNLLALIVTRTGARVDLAESVRDAQALLAKNTYAAALLDKNLPDASGLELLGYIKEHYPKTECLMITGYASTDSAILAVRMGAFDYIVKPFDVATVQHRVQVAIDRVRMAHELADAMVSLKQQALALRESREEIRRAYHESMLRLALAVEYRDDQAPKHVNRISRYAAILAQAISAQSTWIDDLAFAAPLHDIGFVGVPDHILRKAGPLTASERWVMQEHVPIGARILEGASSDVVALAREIVLSHHERWDGSGYPSGKRGEEIPLSGRIVAICDAWDAVSTARVYRRALPFDAAVAEIEGCAGRHFDPTLVSAFDECLPKFRAVLEDPGV